MSLRRDQDAAVLRVRDNGVGMSPQLAARVFELFVQRDEPGKRRVAGLGIGLALVKHWPSCTAARCSRRAAGRGKARSLPYRFQRSNRGRKPPRPSRPRRNRATASWTQRLRGSRRQCRDTRGRRPETRSAVIHIGLPGVDGYAVASALRRDPACQEMVLVAITGFEQPDSLRRAREERL